MEDRRAGTINVWVTDAVTVTPFGDNLNALWLAVLAGKSAIRPLRRFAVEGYHAGIASWIEDLEAIDNRSIGHFLTERLLRQLGPMPPNTLLITATTKSGIDNLERIRRGVPADPGDVLPGSLFEDIRCQLKLTGECFNIGAACASSTVALAQGAELIASGYTNAVLVCCMDLVTEFVFSGFSSLQALSADPCRPFDRDRNGLSLGEGAAALLLMNAEKARQEGRSHLGTILGWATANDATHITAPARDGRGLRQAVLKALDIAGRNSNEIAAVCAHGTGTVHNDLMELNAFTHIFGNRRLPIFSIKGSIGHTLGAAGGIEAAVGLRTLSEQMAPPTVGFSNPEMGAENKVSFQPLTFSGDCLLTTNSGFGGINAALILEKGSLQ
jgi:3-oxoacyl-[acyl-carrier-protein] synthase II